jgi:hypothetical protein
MWSILPAFAIVASSFIPCTEPVWTAHVDPGNQIYPSMVLTMGTAKSLEVDTDLLTDEEREKEEKVKAQTLGDPDGWVFITLKAPSDNAKVKVTVRCDDVMEPSTFKGVLEKQGETYGVAPVIKWKYKELAKVRQAIPTNVVFTVKLGDEEEEEHVRVCTIHTINDCPYLHIEPIEGTDQATIHNLAFMLAGYVNEDHPWIDHLLRDALATRIVENFTGYQEGTEDAVFKQVYSIWNVLQQRGITYSDISRVSTRIDTVPSQHVRFLDESIEMKQANCVDGSVLLASALRKIGIEVFLFVTPNHCYIGFFTDPRREHMVGLETTLLGKADKGTFEKTKALRALLDDEKTFDEASFESFEAALGAGTKSLEADTGKMLGGEFRYMQVIVSEARKQGIRAIPYFPPEKPLALPDLAPAPSAKEEVKNDVRDQLEKLKINK